MITTLITLTTGTISAYNYCYNIELDDAVASTSSILSVTGLNRDMFPIISPCELIAGTDRECGMEVAAGGGKGGVAEVNPVE